MKLLFTESQLVKNFRNRPFTLKNILKNTKSEYTWGAGILPISKKTGKVLVQKRGPGIIHPNEWATFGGKGEKGETHRQAAEREFREESGYKGEIYKLRLLDTHKRENFTFYNYLCIVPDEFCVTTINKPTDAGHIEVIDSKWCNPYEFKWGIRGKLHFGLKRLIHMRKSDIYRYMKKYCDI